MKTHLIGLVKSGPITLAVSDYRQVDGVQLAFSWVASLGPVEGFLTIKLDVVKHGIKVEEDLFAMPTD